MYSIGETLYILVGDAVCPCLVPSMMFHRTASLPHCNVSCCALVTPLKLCIPHDSSKNNAVHQAVPRQ